MPTTKTEAPVYRPARAAGLVAAGILISRLFGLVRQRVISHYFGITTEAADAWAAGFRIPNLLQNLFGEGSLAASFIPVYAGLLAQKRRDDANRLAGTVGALLALAISVFVLAGVLLTPWAIAVIAPGFAGSKRDLTIGVVRILFPGVGFLVVSAWCQGVLNSHRRFLLSYAAPVFWSLTMIGALWWYGGHTDLSRLVLILAWASAAGSGVQLVAQWFVVRRLVPDLRFRLGSITADVRTVVRNFVPTFFTRGVVQVSAFVDTMIASWLPTGAMAAFTNAQTINSLPVSLFGISVSAASLPDLSEVAAGGDEAFGVMRQRLNGDLRRIAFFVVPSAVAFLAFGGVIAGALFQSGRFSDRDAVYVWSVLAGSSVGLLASTLGRLYAASFFALKDTRTPFRFAAARVTLTVVLGYVCALLLPRWLGVDPSWGTGGLTASAGVAGWLEMLLLRRAMNRRIGRTGLPVSHVARLWSAALAGAIVGWAIKLALPIEQPIVVAAAVLGPYGLTFLAVAAALGVDGALPARARVWRRP